MRGDLQNVLVSDIERVDFQKVQKQVNEEDEEIDVLTIQVDVIPIIVESPKNSINMITYRIMA